ncbi:MAG: type I methionyl aminopeptidase [Candidatus Gastranaerophilales bacterium]|nr:type I methionyl aminopeptidase [Candidatus Gastranaerophilales bacterium]
MIHRKSRYQLQLMQQAGAIVAEAHDEIAAGIKPGVSTWELDEIAYNVVTRNKAFPTFKGYNGFPASICASVNEQVVHGIPSKDIILKDGDIISVDIGATFRGMVGDSARTHAVGSVSEEIKTLLKATNEALFAGIEKMSAGNYLEDVSGAIEDVALSYKLGIVRQYGGHGVGAKMHEDPFLFNYRTGNKGPLLKTGMVIAIEPMLNLGCDDVHTLADGWTVVTNDKKPSAHFEHTVAITDNGPLILTKRD